MPAQMVEEEGRFLGETPAVAAQPARFDLQAISPQLMAQGPEGRKAFGDLLAAQKALMGETFSLAEGAKQFQRDPITGEIREVAAGAPKREPVPSNIQAYRLAQEQGYKGSLLDFETQLRQAGATNVKTAVNMPGNQQFLAGVGTNVAETLGNLTAAAEAAKSTLANVDRILPALDKAVLGPGADYRTTMLRVGQQLGIAGPNANDTLAQTATVVQGLAQAELDAAAQMKGQGTLTDAERAILRRAAGGDQSLSAAEIQTGLNAARKNAQARLKLQADYVQRASKLPGFEQFAPLYQVTPYTGGNNPLLNLIDQTLQQRQGRR
jgi:DNA-binding CsgD family transcriptional regulator